MRDERLRKLADVLVNYSTKVKPGDLVLVRGSTLVEPLAVEVYRSVIAAGGHPYMRLSPGSLSEILLKEASEDQLRYISPIEAEIVEKINVSIGIWGDENTKALTGCDPQRQAVRSASQKPLLDRFLRRAADQELRWTGTQFPCQAAAQDAEMSLQEYEDFVFGAGHLFLEDPTAHWQQVGAAQARMVDYLNAKREIRFQAANGTDLTVGVQGRIWINCDGHENFPDGEVFTSPLEDSTDGVVHFSFPAVHGGREVHDVALVFRDGKVIEARAAKGEEFLHRMLDQDEGSRILGEIALGTNYAIKKYTKNTLFDEKIGGTFHAALGAAYPETGGKNSSGLHWDMVCDLRQGGTVWADGEKILENGVFILPGWPEPVSESG